MSRVESKSKKNVKMGVDYMQQFKFVSAGTTKTDFGPQLKSLNKERFTVVGWDPRGNGNSRPPERDFPLNFYERDAKDAVDLMKVQ